jgi:hypothetical protein
MNLTDIEDKINLLLSGDNRKMVFWYDEEAEYIEEIDRNSLAEGRRHWKETENKCHFTSLRSIACSYDDHAHKGAERARFERICDEFGM